MKKIIAAASVGNMLEFYDFALYSIYAKIIGQTFFPAQDPLTTLLISFTVFSTGFLVRPLGAIIFGYISDKWGRRLSLMVSLSCMGVSTFLMGCLPSYASIGMGASVMLVALRLIQGMSAGGEYSTSAMYVMESVTQKRGLIGGYLISTCVFGTVLSTGVSFLIDFCYPGPQSWRFAFLIGALIAFVGIYIRLNLLETGGGASQKDLFEGVLKYSKEILVIVGLGAVNGSIIYSLYGFLPNFLSEVTTLSMDILKEASLAGLISLICMTPLGGAISDQINISKVVYVLSFILFLILLMSFYFFNSGEKYLTFLGFLLLGTSGGLFLGIQNILSFKLIPRSFRCLGVGLGYSFGMALLGGNVGTISLLIYQSTSNIFYTSSCLIGCLLFFLMSFVSLKSSHLKEAFAQ